MSTESDFDRWWPEGQRAVTNPEPREFARAGWEARGRRVDADEAAFDAAILPAVQAALDSMEFDLAEQASGGTWHARNAGRRL